MKSEKAPSIESAIKSLHAVFSLLKENGGEMRGSDLMLLIPKRVTFTDWEKSRNEGRNYERWKAHLSFYLIDAVKSGFLIRKKGRWYLTPEGSDAVDLDPEKLFEKVREGYKSWRLANPKPATSGDKFEQNGSIEPAEEKEIEASEKEVEATLDDVQSRALDGIKDYLDSKNPYEFQDLCAALLRGMGYTIRPLLLRAGETAASILSHTVIPWERIHQECVFKLNIESKRHQGRRSISFLASFAMTAMLGFLFRQADSRRTPTKPQGIPEYTSSLLTRSDLFAYGRTFIRR